MNIRCLDYLLTSDERARFERDGYLVLDNALPPERVATLAAALDRVDARERAHRGSSARVSVNTLDLLGRNEAFFPLLDWPRILPKVWGILGWNIQLYHSHGMVTPPHATGGLGQSGLNWHQDSGRLNRELETEPQPRISVKVAYFLSDTSAPGRANLCLVPGSHLRNRLDRPEGGNPEGAMAVLAPPGTAVIFDRRLWHSSSPNRSDITRKVIFLGYSYRWLRPRDDMTVAQYMDRCTPIQRQLLGHSPNGGFGYSSPAAEDVPLREWLREYLPSPAAAEA